ncbi:MAG TPA: GNAT family N-acetyltransferase, partial [Calditrichia bacterium]|nr:GNAT family N-acetyltransferase [Calditrichia bacterium]
ARQDTRLWGIRDGETWVGLVGLSPVGEDMLLRSLGVDLAYRQGGLGGQLTGFAVAQAGSEGAGRIFLLTTTAAAFFEKYGFRRLERDAVPPAIARHRQFTSLCPDSAVVMVLER